MKNLEISGTTTSMASTLLVVCSRLEEITFECCPLVTEHIQSIFSNDTLRRLHLSCLDLSNFETVNAFCLGVEASSLELMELDNVSFPPEYEARVVATLANSRTLVDFSCCTGGHSSFCERYCEVLSNNVDTKLERLFLLDEDSGSVSVLLHGDLGQACSGLETAMEADLRRLLGLNDQRSTGDTMTRAQRALESWLEKRRKELQEQLQILRDRASIIKQEDLIMLTLDRPVFEALRQTLQNLPIESKNELQLESCSEFALDEYDYDHEYRHLLPCDNALLATATELAHIASSADSFRSVSLKNSTASISSSFLAACPRLERVSLKSCPLRKASLRSIFSIEALREVEIEGRMYLDPEAMGPKAIDALCLGLESSSLKVLRLSGISFPPDHEAQVATVLSRCNTLVHLEYDSASPSFCNYFCGALSAKVDTKFERLNLRGEQNVRISLDGDRGLVRGLDAAIEGDIRFYLGLNVQRTTCAPLFAAIDDAETDVARRTRLVDGFVAAGCPLTFEYIRSNQWNLIFLIQQLGRSESGGTG